MNKKIFVSVIGGVAYPLQATVPPGYEVEIVNFDDIDETGEFPSKEALEYYLRTGLYEERSGAQRAPKCFEPA